MALKGGTILNKTYIVLKTLKEKEKGNTYLVKRLRDGKRLIVKEYIFSNEKEREAYFREAEIMAGFNHRGLPGTHGIFSRNDREYLTMDYIKGKTLKDILKEEKKPFPEEKALKWTLELAEILDYLHSAFKSPVIYNNLEPSNIVITKEGRLALTGFSKAIYYNPHEKSPSFIPGPHGYTPPEAKKGEISLKTDVYAIGVISYQMLTGYNIAAKNFKFKKIKLRNPSVPDELENIIKSALEREAVKRYMTVKDFKKALEKYMGIAVSEAKEFPGTGCIIIGAAISVPIILLTYSSFKKILDIYSINNFLVNITATMLSYIIFLYFMYRGSQTGTRNQTVMALGGIIFLLIIAILPYGLIAKAELNLNHCKSNLKVIAKAIELYSADTNGFYYPPSLDYLTGNSKDGNLYMKEIPLCPLSSNSEYGYTCSNRGELYNFTLWCNTQGHKGGDICTDGKWPQYNPIEGVKLK